MRGCALALAISASLPVFGQCPRADTDRARSEIRTLEGRLIFHDSIRKWFELKLDQPECGQASVQLVRSEGDWTLMETLRGCRIRSRGSLDFSPTGYYSLDVYQDVLDVDSVGACVRQPPFPDFSKAKPDQAVREYRVDMRLNYGPGDHPISFTVSSGAKKLRPWQAYARYWLTGGLVLYGLCGEGFVVDQVFGTPDAKPRHFVEPRDPGDMAVFDPETAAAAGTTDLRLGFTCVRDTIHP